MKSTEYIPALRYHFLTPIYDVFIKSVVPEKKVKTRTVELAQLKPDDNVLDFGCGTGTLLQFLKEKHPATECTGVDNDPRMMKVAKEKLSRVSKVQLVEYAGHSLPFIDNSFNAVVSTWVFHHLTNEQKAQAFTEIYRVLKPNGKFVVADWGKPQNGLMKFLFFILRIVDNFEATQVNFEGRLPEFMRAANFRNVEIVGNQSTLLGTLTYYTATK
ncbi:MAG: ubiquinone/menaquinone biosynthesis C-methylase UbiE [Spirosomataceae bacterium]